ncbi:MAG: amidohydrolase family protein [Oscillospiraceae bacterium]
MRDTVIYNAMIVQPTEKFMGSVEIEGGKIAAITAGEGAPNCASKELIDASGLILLPGMIDTHVHIRGAALSHREDFSSGTRAAASGGVTTIIEMPISSPPASRSEDLLNRKKEISAVAYVDFALYGGAGADNLDEIQALSDAGAVAYKTFLMPPVPGRENEFFGLCCETPQLLTKAMEKVAPTGKLLAVHSELNSFVSAETKRIMDEGRNGLVAFCESRPPEAETEGVKWVIEAAKKTGCKVSICHCSTPETVELIVAARRDGVDIHAETCPQYICFDRDAAAPAGVFARIKPPYRDKESMKTLRSMYKDGLVEITGSDHAPYLSEEKLRNGQDIWHTFDGLPGLELSLLLLLNLVKSGDLTYEAIARNTAETPAKLFGFESKGKIALGADADLVLVEKLQSPQKVDISKLFTKARESAVLYDGLALDHRIVRTILRGKTIFADGAITGASGYGKMILAKQ